VSRIAVALIIKEIRIETSDAFMLTPPLEWGKIGGAHCPFKHLSAPSGHRPTATVYPFKEKRIATLEAIS
jgi:hypothetical protein